MKSRVILIHLDSKTHSIHYTRMPGCSNPAHALATIFPLSHKPDSHKIPNLSAHVPSPALPGTCSRASRTHRPGVHSPRAGSGRGCSKPKRRLLAQGHSDCQELRDKRTQS